MKIYFNVKYGNQVETVDEYDSEEFKPSEQYPKFLGYVRAMLKEYHIAGDPVYTSQRCTKDWRNR